MKGDDEWEGPNLDRVRPPRELDSTNRSGAGNGLLSGTAVSGKTA